MDDSLHTALREWTDFYLITGTAAAALTGLQFVVQTLIASDARRAVSNTDPEAGIAAFGTPTVVHFTLALLLSALACVPWPAAAELRAVLVVVGAAALAYSVVVLRRARRQQGYVPVAEDWVWHVALPGVAYAAVLVAGLRLGRGEAGPLFAIAGAALLLICVGIHNAWDTVTYLTVSAVRSGGGAPEAERTPPRRDAAGPAAARGRRRR